MRTRVCGHVHVCVPSAPPYQAQAGKCACTCVCSLVCNCASRHACVCCIYFVTSVMVTECVHTCTYLWMCMCAFWVTVTMRRTTPAVHMQGQPPPGQCKAVSLLCCACTRAAATTPRCKVLVIACPLATCLTFWLTLLSSAMSTRGGNTVPADAWPAKLALPLPLPPTGSSCAALLPLRRSRCGGGGGERCVLCTAAWAGTYGRLGCSVPWAPCAVLLLDCAPAGCALAVRSAGIPGCCEAITVGLAADGCCKASGLAALAAAGLAADTICSIGSGAAVGIWEHTGLVPPPLLLEVWAARTAWRARGLGSGCCARGEGG